MSALQELVRNTNKPFLYMHGAWGASKQGGLFSKSFILAHQPITVGVYES
jgi:hypothetical protein